MPFQQKKAKYRDERQEGGSNQFQDTRPRKSTTNPKIVKVFTIRIML